MLHFSWTTAPASQANHSTGSGDAHPCRARLPVRFLSPPQARALSRRWAKASPTRRPSERAASSSRTGPEDRAPGSSAQRCMSYAHTPHACLCRPPPPRAVLCPSQRRCRLAHVAGLSGACRPLFSSGTPPYPRTASTRSRTPWSSSTPRTSTSTASRVREQRNNTERRPSRRPTQHASRAASLRDLLGFALTAAPCRARPPPAWGLLAVVDPQPGCWILQSAAASTLGRMIIQVRASSACCAAR